MKTDNYAYIESEIYAIIIGATSALWLYCMAHLYTIYSDMYIPSPIWRIGGISITIVLAAWILTRKNLRQKISTKDKTFLNQSISYGLIFIFFSFLVHPAITGGLGEILTENFGKQGITQFFVTKDLNTKIDMIKTTVTGYCLNSPRFKGLYSRNDFCIKKFHYDRIPENGMTMDFMTITSPLGMVIKDYHWPELQEIPSSDVPQSVDAT